MRFNILDFLLPRETKFYDLFNDHADRLLKASKRLRELGLGLEAAAQKTGTGGGEGGPSAAADGERRDILKTAVAAIKEIERDADKIEGRINDALEESFITPLDREDIHLIASFVDNAIDAIKALANKIETYGVLRLPPRSIEYCDIIVECAQSLAEAFSRIQKRSSVTSEAKIIGDAERKADVLFSIAIGDLFVNGRDAIEVLKSKEIYEGLEEVVNRIDSASKVLRRVMIKQG
jgi:uncharacterized protein Yka (UPF0111/DUF47 family)